MSNNKSPGSDGLGIESYKTSWNNIKLVFMASLERSEDLKELFDTQRERVISRASFCCTKNVRKLHLILTKVAVKSCIYAQVFKSIRV